MCVLFVNLKGAKMSSVRVVNFNTGGAMWSSVPAEAPGPPGRTKHSVTLLGGRLYLLGGRNGNVPLKDLWAYRLAEGKWQKLSPSGDTPPCLQEHSAVAYKGHLYVFGGEVGFASTETPLWVYSVQDNRWRKVRYNKNDDAPRGRRGHCALVLGGHMLLHGGYQDLRGSSDELWAFHFESESWRLLWPRKRKGVEVTNPMVPPPRHKHSALLHGNDMWIYGGMTDLQERQDCWKWSTVRQEWTCVRTKLNPGPLHSHAACRLPGAMLLFGGESGGNPTNELWRFSFGTETWEKLNIVGVGPQPRSQSVALSVSPLHLRADTPLAPPPYSPTTQRPPSYCFPGNRVSPCAEEFRPSNEENTNDSSNGPTGFLKEISKFSQNIPRLGGHGKCNYSMLASADDSTESLLRVNEEEEQYLANLPKSQSSHTLQLYKIPRDPVSVPNFRALSPAMSPVNGVGDFTELHRRFRPNGEESYSSHLCDGDGLPKSASVRFQETKFAEDAESTSDYASVEAVNRLAEYGPFGFCNPHYLGPDVHAMLLKRRPDDDTRAQQARRALDTPDSGLDNPPFGEEGVELSALPTRRTRARSAGRGEGPGRLPVFVYILGGKEQQASVFQKPLSMWRLQL